ncbi:carbohydrate kinase family protein [Nocardia flavorosea]|uniref:Carbohydrate kinase family protein n=1 Tax=Nocardia flavorosea TaxID=53429 RepID=A0A846YA77_9NOCA|nr:carbohydrate kinase family protein [Nocardia flavorosea]NKY54684.1 carbohydrate kinase family protein [Nocardia flavorosea]
MSPTDDTAIVAIRNILTRLCKRSGLSPDRLATTEIDIIPLLDLPVIRRYAATHGITRTAAVLPVIREHARRLPPTHRVITDAELSLGLLRETETTGVDPDDLYSQDLGDRRKYLSAHWRRLHEIADAEAIPPAPTVRSLRATPERRAFTALAALLVTGNIYTDPRSPHSTGHGNSGRIGTLTIVGDAVIDHIYRVDEIPDARGFARGRFSDNPGGKGLDRAVAAARLGIDVRLISAVGDDEAGRRILDYLRSEKVDTSLVRVVPDATTPLTALIVGKTGIAGTIFCEDDRIRLTTAELSGPAIQAALTETDAVLVTLEPPLPVIERVLATLQNLPKRPTLLLAAAQAETPQVLYRYLSTVDYLIGSTQELDSMVPEIPARSGAHIARQLQMLGTRVVCVVEDFGCTVRSDRLALEIPRFQAAALTDVPGSRGAFSAALVYRLLSRPAVADGEGGPICRVADEQDYTWATAAMVATQSFAGDVPGAMPTADEVDRIIRLTAERH